MSSGTFTPSTRRRPRAYVRDYLLLAAQPIGQSALREYLLALLEMFDAAQMVLF